jgi:hypothetical protein
MFSCLKFKVFLISSLVGDSFRSFCTSSVLGKYVVFWQSGIASFNFPNQIGAVVQCLAV